MDDPKRQHEQKNQYDHQNDPRPAAGPADVRLFAGLVEPNFSCPMGESKKSRQAQGTANDAEGPVQRGRPLTQGRPRDYCQSYEDWQCKNSFHSNLSVHHPTDWAKR